MSISSEDVVFFQFADVHKHDLALMLLRELI